MLDQRRTGAPCRDCHGKPTGSSPCGNCDGQRCDGGVLVSECVAFDTDKDADDVIRKLKHPRDAVGTTATLPWETMLSDAVARMQAGETSSEEVISAFGAGGVEAYAVGRVGHET